MKKFNKYLLLLPLIGAISACSDDENECKYDTSYALLGENDNMPTGGIIIAQFSDSQEGQDVSKVVDANTDTKYTTGHNAFYITWKGNQKVAITGYAITSADDAPEKDPKSWILSASNDNVTWVKMDTQDGQTFNERKETKDFNLENETEYLYYRLEIKENSGSSDTQIAEWILR